MTTAQHGHVREHLLDDHHDHEVEAHLERCSECERFARQLGRMREAAAALASTGMPAGLADRVVGRVRDEVGGAGVPPHPASTPAAKRAGLDVRRMLLRSAAIAAAVLVVLGVLVVSRNPGDDSPREVLLAAATATEQAGPAAVEVEGTVEMTVELGDDPAQPPDLSGLPDELHGYIEQRWQEAMRRWEQQMEEFSRQVDEMFRRSGEQIEGAFDQATNELDRAIGELGRLGAGGADAEPRSSATEPSEPARPSRPNGPHEPTEPAPPHEVSARIVFSAAGDLAVGDLVRLRGNVSANGDRARVPFEVAAEADRSAIRSGTSGWVGVGDPSGPLAVLLARADGISRVLRGASGRVERAGEERIGDVAVERYRFAVDRTTLGLAGGLGDRWIAEAWIDGDRLVRKLAMTSTGSAGAAGSTGWETELRLHLSGFGRQAVAVTAAPDTRGATVRAATGVQLLYYPFGVGVAAVLEQQRPPSGTVNGR